MATLLIHHADRLEREVPLTGATVRLGRAMDNDVVLSEVGISKYHAEVRFEDGEYAICDVGSTNGIWVGERAVTRQSLTGGIQVDIAPYKISLSGASASAEFQTLAPGARVPDTAPTPVRPQPPPTPPRRPKSVSTATLMVGIVGSGVTLIVLIAAFLNRTAAPPQTATNITSPQPAGNDATTPTAPDSDPPSAPESASETEHGGPDAATGIDPSTGEPPAGDQTPTPAGGQGDSRRRRPPSSIWPVDIPVVPAKPGESATELLQRARQLHEQYADAKSRLDRGDPAGAIPLLAKLVEQQPDYQDAPTLLAEARQREQERRRQIALRHLGEARTLSGAGDLVNARREYQLALDDDGPVAAAAREELARLIIRMTDEGVALVKSANVAFSRGREADARAQYQKAVSYLPSEHPDRLKAEERLNALPKD